MLKDVIPTQSTTKINRVLGNQNANLNPKTTLGHGFFSVVRPDRDPHMVKKYNQSSWLDDPFNDYINYIINHNLTHNIYFPKIYNIKTLIDSKGKEIKKFTIEKLIPYTEIRPQELEAILDRCLNMDSVESLNQDYSDSEYLQSVFCNELSRSFRNNFTKIKDDNLRNALRTIKRIIAESQGKFSLDFHLENIMYRRTSKGIQPVISDPLA